MSKIETIAVYHTRSGLVAFEVKRYTKGDGSHGYSYTGKHGAGCGKLEDIANDIRTTMATRKGIKFISGTDITQGA